MSLNYADQVQKMGTVTVSNPAVAVNLVLGWQPRYVRAINVNNLASYEYFDSMDDGTSLDNGNDADTQWSVNAADSITLYAGRNAGAAVTGTVAVTAASPTITGTSTNFVGELAVGDKVTINGETVAILSITSSTVATADKPFVATATGASLYDMLGKGEGVTLGTDICDTAADVIRWVAFR
jgi:hypothetical protein